jgi:cell division protein ZapA (FtsZ GTPase activity inhibitor)
MWEALLASKFAQALKRVPRQVWLVLAALLALACLVAWHQHIAHKAIADAERRGSDKAYAAVAKKAQAVAATMEKLNADIRKLTDAKNRTIAADATALRVRGPGRALCTSTASSPASGHQPPPGAADAPVGQVPNGGGTTLIAVPYDDLVAYAEQHDLDLAEIVAWRTGDEQQRAVVEKAK